MKTDDTGDLHIPEFAHGYLLAVSYQIFKDVTDDDDWQQVPDVPLLAGEHCVYFDYDLNFWYDEDEDEWHCTAYESLYSGEGYSITRTSAHRRLW